MGRKGGSAAPPRPWEGKNGIGTGSAALNGMEKVRDEQYPYDALGTTAWCDLQVYRGADGAVPALCAERADNPGPSITSWAAPLAEAVWRQAGEPPVFTWIEHYPLTHMTG